MIGPITRNVAVSAIMLEAIAGSDPRDPESSSNPIPKYFANLKDGVKGKTFGIPQKPFFEELHPDTHKVMDDALRVIKELGGTLKEVEVKYMDIATPTGFNIVLAECPFVTKPWEEDKLIGIAYGFEQVTKVRKPPKL